MAWRVPPFLIAGVSIVVLLLMYRSAKLDLSCNNPSEDRWSPSFEEVSSTSTGKHHDESASADEQATKSVTQFLREKVAKGVFQTQDRAEFADLDISTKQLLSEVVVESVSHPSLASAVEQQGIFDLNYGVMRVVRRFVVCSSYRTSLQSFSLITLSPEFTIYTSNPDYKDLPIPDPSVYPTCLWLEDGSAGAPLFGSMAAMNATGRGSVTNGKAVFRWMNEVHGTSYDTVMVHCTFPEPVGTKVGGYLYMNISHGKIGTGAPSELVPVLHESANQLQPALYEATEFQYEYAYCSASSFTPLIASHVKQFLMYHHVMFEGKLHFFFYYSAPIEEEVMAVLKPLIGAGVLTLVDFSKESNYHIMYHGQAPAINDCLYRTKFLARWSLFWDLDEYLYFPSPSTYTIQSLLEEHKDAAWISFGKYDFRFSHCRPNKTEHDWGVERMVYRMEKPFCMENCNQERCGEMCPSEKGMRKWIVNPRKARSAVTHSISDPKNLDGVMLNTKVARFNHYRGVVAPKAKNSCAEIRDPEVDKSIKDTDGRTTLIMDEELANLVTASSIKSTAESLKIFGGNS
ncbi:unnamed protein product [Calypogeia fissa]